MSDRIFEGKDLAEALAEASTRLGIAEPDLDYEIVEQGRRGLFGIGAKSVQIRVMPPIDAETKAAGHGELAGVPGGGRRRRRRGRRSGGGGNERAEGSEREERGDRGDREGRPPRREAPPKAARAEREEREPSPPAPDEAVEGVQAKVTEMVGLAGLELEVAAKGVPGGTQVEFDGPDQELLIEGDAEAIGAWQFLLNRMSRRTWPEAGRIHVYCNGHEQTRDEDLLELARETAEEVLQDGRAVRLQPMNSYERRLVHLTVRKMRGVDSRSEGDGPLKRVRVFKRDGAGKGRGRRRGRGRGRRRRAPRE